MSENMDLQTIQMYQGVEVQTVLSNVRIESTHYVDTKRARKAHMREVCYRNSPPPLRQDNADFYRCFV